MNENGLPYYERLDKLEEAVRAHGPVRCGELAWMLGWPSSEVRGKLQSLKSSRRVDFDADAKKWSGR